MDSVKAHFREQQGPIHLYSTDCENKISYLNKSCLISLFVYELCGGYVSFFLDQFEAHHNRKQFFCVFVSGFFYLDK